MASLRRPRIARRITGKRPVDLKGGGLGVRAGAGSQERARSPRQASRSRSRSPRAEKAQSRPRLSRAHQLEAEFKEPAERTDAGRIRKSLAHRGSFIHRNFANPEAETCWLSCLFQALWHSVVFHRAFEQHLAHSESGCEERLLSAMRATWAAYQAGKPEAPGLELEENEDSEGLIPPAGLAEAFGAGYGDMSEALAQIQDELSQSGSPAAIAIAEQMVLVPLSALAGPLPGPPDAWQLAEEWQVTSSPLLAVDLTVSEPTREESRCLAELWVPGEGKLGLSSSHRLVALVCFMWNFRHYVAFCRRQQDPSRCLFFNDLPCLTPGAPTDLPWRDVPQMCEEHYLTPRLLLYESITEEVQPSNSAP